MNINIAPSKRGKVWFGDAYGTFKKYPWIFIGFTAIDLVLNYIVGEIPKVGIYISGFLSAVFMASWVIFLGKERMGTAPKLENLFLAFKKEYLTKILILTALEIVLGIALFIPLLLFGVGFTALTASAFAFASNMWGAILASLGALFAFCYLFIFVFLISSIFAYAMPLLIRKKQDPWNAIVLSVKAGYLNIGPLSYLWLIQFGVMLLCLLTLGLGFLVLLPLIKISHFNAYLDTFE